jgi:nucleotide-binding universal stress UspA family protein
LVRISQDFAFKLLKKILVGYDGTEQALRVLEYAITLVEGDIADSVSIHLAYVVEKPSGVVDPVPDEVMESLGNLGHDILSNGARIVRKHLESPTTHLEFGSPPEKLVELADKLKPDIVIIGMAKHPTSERIVGTVSTLFYKLRRFPVLGVP